MAKIDVDDLKARVDIVDVIGQHVHLVPREGEFIAPCPFHQETKASFTVSPAKQFFYCFGCGASGDVIDFVQQYSGLGFREAVQALADGRGITPRTEGEDRPARRKARPQAPEWAQVRPVPQGAPEPRTWARDRTLAPLEHPILGRPARSWTYLDAAGAVLGYVCRFETAEGKEVIPLSYGSLGGRPPEWRWKSFSDPRPLYGLDRLAARPGAQVLVVEGEKTADAAQQLLPGVVVVTWPGGSKALGKVDWTPLAGRKICIWPDGDAQRYGDTHPLAGELKPLHEQAGTAAALKIAGILAAQGCDYIRVVRYPDPGADGAPVDGWDLADALDEGWDTNRVTGYLRAHVSEPWGAPGDEAAPAPEAGPGRVAPARNRVERRPDPEPQGEQPQDAPAPMPEPGDVPPPEVYDADTLAPDDYGHEPPEPPGNNDIWASAHDWPFLCLGHAGGLYYFLPRTTGEVTALTPGSIQKNSLLQLAPLDWWELMFPGAKSRVSWMDASDALMTRCHSVGFFDACRIRGRGAWEDAGRSVVHLGDRLVVDGRAVPIHEHSSRYIYIRRPGDDTRLPAPASAREAHELVQLCDMLTWERPIYGRYLAGWIVCAHVCGALRWRPHIWITGESGAGKTSVYDNILRAALRDHALPCQSASTEAGIRQALGSDALPVIFDEAESETVRGRDRIRTILELVRQASSENGAAILKGSVSGQAQEYRIRSCFAFCSIVVAAEQKADVSRITVLTLRRYSGPDAAQRFRGIAEVWAQLLTPDFVAALRARCVRLIPVIVRNAETFAGAVAVYLGSRRYGDQIGTLLAGAYALHSDRVISPEDAAAWVAAQDWAEASERREDGDEERLLLHLLQQPVTVEAQSTGASLRRTVGELARVLAYGLQGEAYSSEAAHAAISRAGVRVVFGPQPGQTPYLVVSDSHAAIKTALRDTPWGTGWSRILERIPGAERQGCVRFGGATTRAVRIPVAATPVGDQNN